MRGHHNKRGAPVGAAACIHRLAAKDVTAGGLRFGQRCCHRLPRRCIDQRAHEDARRHRIADLRRSPGGPQARDQRICNLFVHEQAAHRGAALAGRAECGKGDGAHRQVKIRRRTDDGGIVAAEFEDRLAEARRHDGRYGASHPRRAGGRDDGDTRIGSKLCAGFWSADQAGRKAIRRIAELARRPREDRHHGKRCQRRFLGWFPDHRIAANERQRGVPGPDRNREIEGRDDGGDARRVPGFHHPVARAFGGNRQSVQLAGETDGKVADVDHLLHFAHRFRRDLAGLERHEGCEIILGAAQLLAEQADEFAASRRRNVAPLDEGR